MNVQMRDAATARAAKFGGDGATDDFARQVPLGAERMQPFKSSFRASKVEVDGKQFNKLEGYASTVDEPYEMYDWAGPYMEIVDRNAFDVTLGNAPDVSFLVNHKGLTMARTVSNTLTLSVDDSGLHSVAFVNPKRGDVKDLVIALEDGTITEMSFAFMIVRGKWSPDYSEYRIMEVDLNRGDVSAVNYGANPYTSIAARSAEIVRDAPHLPAGARREVARRLAAMVDDHEENEDETIRRDATEKPVEERTEGKPEAEQRLGTGRSLADIQREAYSKGSPFLGDLDKVAAAMNKGGDREIGRSTQLLRAKLRSYTGE